MEGKRETASVPRGTQFSRGDLKKSMQGQIFSRRVYANRGGEEFERDIGKIGNRDSVTISTRGKIHTKGQNSGGGGYYDILGDKAT